MLQNVPEADRTGSRKESLRPSSEGSKCYSLKKYLPSLREPLSPESPGVTKRERQREPPSLGPFLCITQL